MTLPHSTAPAHLPSAGAIRSMDRVTALNFLATEMGEVQFPATRAQLLKTCGDVNVPIGEGGATIPLREILGSLNAESFSSSEHVREVVNLAWQDWATERRSDYGSG